MIYPALSILFSVTILVFFKLLKPKAGSTLLVITVNYLVATLLGAITSDQGIGYGRWEWPNWTPFAIALGFLFISTFFLFALSSRQAGVALTAVASRVSVIIPVLGGLLIFGEKAGITRWAGLVLVFPALYYTLYNKSNDEFNPKKILLPLALMLGTGMNDLLMNYATRFYAPVDLHLMLSMIFGLSFIIGLIVLAFNYLKRGLRPDISLIPAGIFLGLINYASTYFLMLSMNHFEATLLFPVVNTSIVVLAAVVDLSFFGQRLSRQQWAGITMALISIVLITRG